MSSSNPASPGSSSASPLPPPPLSPSASSACGVGDDVGGSVVPLTTQQACMLLHNLKQLYSPPVAWQIVELGATQSLTPEISVNLFYTLGISQIFQVNHVMKYPVFRIQPQTRRLVAIEQIPATTLFSTTDQQLQLYPPTETNIRVLHEYAPNEKMPKDKPILRKNENLDHLFQHTLRANQQAVELVVGNASHNATTSTTTTNSAFPNFSPDKEGTTTTTIQTTYSSSSSSSPSPSSSSSSPPIPAQIICQLLLNIRRDHSGEIAWKIAEIGLMQYVPSAKIATALYNLLGERFLLEQLNPLLMEHKTRFRKVEKFNVLVFRQLDGRERILKLEDATQMLDDDDDEEDEDYLEQQQQQQQQETYSQDENLSSTHSNTEVVSNIHDLADDVSDITTNLEPEEDDISSCFDPEEEADDLDDDGESYMGDDSTAPPSSSFWQEPDSQEARELTYDHHIYHEEQQRYDGCPDPSQPEQYTQPSSNLNNIFQVRVMSDTSASGVTNHSRNSDGNVERRRRSRRKSKMIKNSNENNINNNISDGNHNNSNGNYHANNNNSRRRRHENKFIRALRSMVWGSTKFMVQKTATCLYVSLVGPMTRKRLTNLKRRFLKQKAASEEAAGYRHRNSSSDKKRHPRRSSISQIESTASIPYPASQGSM